MHESNILTNRNWGFLLIGKQINISTIFGILNGWIHEATNKKNKKNEHKHTNLTDKADVPIDDQDGKSYSDEKLIEIIDQSLQIMDKNNDGYVSFPEFVSTQESLKQSDGQ